MCSLLSSFPPYSFCSSFPSLSPSLHSSFSFLFFLPSFHESKTPLKDQLLLLICVLGFSVYSLMSFPFSVSGLLPLCLFLINISVYFLLLCLFSSLCFRQVSLQCGPWLLVLFWKSLSSSASCALYSLIVSPLIKNLFFTENFWIIYLGKKTMSSLKNPPYFLGVLFIYFVLVFIAVFFPYFPPFVLICFRQLTLHFFCNHRKGCDIID